MCSVTLETEFLSTQMHPETQYHMENIHKDYSRGKDEQGNFLENSEFYGGFICIIRLFGQSHPFALHCTAIQLRHVIIIAGWWVTVDFDAKCRILWDETRAHGV